jgi:hypothetical protein
MLQYTIHNIAGGFAPGRDVVIRTHDRALAVSWMTPGYRVTPKDRGRDYYGLRALERRAAARVQYGLAGIAPDSYYNQEG